MKIVSWTLEGIAEHADAVLAWLEKHDPVVVCLRGTWIEDSAFPLVPLWELGYYTKLFGAADQPGLAILSVEPPRNVHRGLTAEGGAGERRAGMSGTVAGIRILNVVAPVEEEAIRAYLDRRVAPQEKVLVVGAPAGVGGLEELTRGHDGLDHRVLANAQLATRCGAVELAEDVPTGMPAVAVTFEGLPPPQIPDLDITR